jgi:hypothetical protein
VTRSADESAARAGRTRNAPERRDRITIARCRPRVGTARPRLANFAYGRHLSAMDVVDVIALELPIIAWFGRTVVAGDCTHPTTTAPGPILATFRLTSRRTQRGRTISVRGRGTLVGSTSSATTCESRAACAR